MITVLLARKDSTRIQKCVRHVRVELRTVCSVRWLGNALHVRRSTLFKPKIPVVNAHYSFPTAFSVRICHRVLRVRLDTSLRAALVS